MVLLKHMVCAALGISLPSAFATADSPGIVWDAPIIVAEGGGTKGPWRQNESDFDYVDDATVALSDDGDAVIAWTDQRRKDVLLQRYDAHGKTRFNPPVNVSRNGKTFSWLPRIAVGTANRIYVLWQEIIFSGGSHGGDMLFARSDDGGASFSAPINLSNSIGGDGKGRITEDFWHNGSYDLANRDSVLYAVWTEYDGMLWLSRSTDGGKTFSAPRHITGGKAAPARAPSIAVTTDGKLYLAWTLGDDEGADIHLAYSTDGGQSFSPPMRIEPNRTYSDAPKLAVDFDGMLHLVYCESSGGPFDAFHIRYTRSQDGIAFEAAREISSPTPRGTVSNAFPHLSFGAHNTIYVMWDRFVRLRDHPRGMAVTISHDGGKHFTTPALVPRSAGPEGSSSGSHQGLLMNKLAADMNARIAIVTSSLQRNVGSAVWLMRGRSAVPGVARKAGD